MNQTSRKTLEQVVQETGRYPLEAFEFVRGGLNYTVSHIHGQAAEASDAQCHVSGQQLCDGLRRYALSQYGVLAKAVLGHWGIRRTNDFGKIVWAMVEGRLMQKTEGDELAHFDEVYDFRTAFEPPVRAPRAHKASFAL